MFIQAPLFASKVPKLLVSQVVLQTEKLRQEEESVVSNQGPTVCSGSRKPMFKQRRIPIYHAEGKVPDCLYLPESGFPTRKSNTNLSDDASHPRRLGWSRLPPLACAIEDLNPGHHLDTPAHCRGRQKTLAQEVM